METQDNPRDGIPTTKDGLSSKAKKLVAGGGVGAVIVALITVYGTTHGQTTAISRNDTPVVINRPHDAHGSPLPVTITTQKAGPPIVIVGSDGPKCNEHGTDDNHLRPDPACTPGVVDSKVTVADVCPHLDRTAQTRNVSAAEKRQVLIDYGYDPATFKGEIDHLISKELLGSDDIKNLFPQPGPIPNAKDRTENRLHVWVCAGGTTAIQTDRVHQAQQAIRTDWTTADRIIH